MIEPTTQLPQVINQPQGNFSIVEVKAQVTAMHQLFKDVLKVEMHYGTIPGTDKPTLFKAGAEKIGLLLRLSPAFKREITMSGDHMTVLSTCTLTRIDTGAMIAEAGAICSTRESKYAYRQATRKCPECGKESIIKGKKEYGGGWLCFAKKGGCGTKWKDGDNAIESLSEGQKENPNIPDTYNTVLKIADKRAYVAAILFGTAASDIYTQDWEDFNSPGSEEEKKKPIVGNDITEDINGLDEALRSGGFPGLQRWWRANYARINSGIYTMDALTAITAHKDMLKSQSEPPSVQTDTEGPTDGETESKQAGKAGRPRAVFKQAKDAMEKAAEAGTVLEYWEEQEVHLLDVLTEREMELFKGLYDEHLEKQSRTEASANEPQ